VVNDGEVMGRIAEGAWLYVLEDRVRAGRFLVTMAVSDLEEAVNEIRDRGIISAPIEGIGSAGRKASFTDPEGNVSASSRWMPTDGPVHRDGWLSCQRESPQCFGQTLGHLQSSPVQVPPVTVAVLPTRTFPTWPYPLTTSSVKTI